MMAYERIEVEKQKLFLFKVIRIIVVATAPIQIIDIENGKS
jgi:hypothetical protein